MHLPGVQLDPAKVRRDLARRVLSVADASISTAPHGDGNGNMSLDIPRPRSAAVFDGPDRAPARAYMKGIGFADDDLRKPDDRDRQHLDRGDALQLPPPRRSPSKVKEGVRAAGGTPMEFNTVAVSDGVTMGTQGMKASLVSREVIADSIELTARGYQFDALIAISACDKTIPGARDGARSGSTSRPCCSTAARSPRAAARART